MHAVPTALSLLVAAAIAPGLVRSMQLGGHTRANYRGRDLAFPLGVLAAAAALIALLPVTLIERISAAELLEAGTIGAVLLYGLGTLLLGLIDDTLGSADGQQGRSSPRGWRGHIGALAAGEPSTGVLKAVGSLALALLVLAPREASTGRWLLAAAVLVLATNALNLLDLRPGRAGKAFVLVWAAMAAVKPWLLWALGPLAAPALVACAYDLRERAMLGDSGANLLGALAGLALVFALGQTGQLIALAGLLSITLYGEFFSISGLVERTPWLRHLDSWGRPL